MGDGTALGRVSPGLRIAAIDDPGQGSTHRPGEAIKVSTLETFQDDTSG